jgi:hypothetical protein
VADDQILAEIEQKLVASLPISTRATEAALIEHDDTRNLWRFRKSFALQ